MTALVSPAPPLAGEELAHIGAGLRFMEAPTEYLAELRARHGDTFFVDVFGFPLLVTFSATGLESLYRLEEQDASFGLATYDMMGFKTPGELFRDVDTGLFRALMEPARVAAYLPVIDAVVQEELARWGDSGTLDLFDAIRTLEQRVGFALWIAPEAASGRWWPRLKAHFDVLDQERAFVDPSHALETIRSGKSAERSALGALRDMIAEIAAERDAARCPPAATLDLLRERFADEAPEARARKIAHNCVNANQGFLSNLYAAIAWTVVRLLEHPAVLSRVDDELAAARARDGDGFLHSADALNRLGYCEQVFMESIRLGQRSITLRKVLRPLDFDTGDAVYRVQPGVYITTMLSVTNTQTEELKRFDPGHYQGNRLHRDLATPGRETVSTFGHGRHACPAQRFSHHMAKIVLARLLERFRLQARFSAPPQPARRQMGGVARPQEAVVVAYSLREKP